MNDKIWVIARLLSIIKKATEQSKLKTDDQTGKDEIKMSKRLRTGVNEYER